MWCIPKITPEFKEAMYDVLDVYERPYTPQFPVVCFDEKTHQLLSTPRGEYIAAQTATRRQDYEYKRHGTVNHFVAVEPKAGKRTIRVTDRKTAVDFARFIKHLVMNVYSKASKVILVLDNLSTHTEKAIVETYGEEEGKKICSRIEWHYTPTHASWLNMAEIEIGVLQKNVLCKRIGEKELLRREVRAYQIRRNRNRSTISWRFTKQKAKEVFKLHDN
jgi:hypothetical protein